MQRLELPRPGWLRTFINTHAIASGKKEVLVYTSYPFPYFYICYFIACICIQFSHEKAFLLIFLNKKCSLSKIRFKYGNVKGHVAPGLSVSPKHLPVFAMAWTLGHFHSNIHHTNDDSQQTFAPVLFLLHLPFHFISPSPFPRAYIKSDGLRKSPYLSIADAVLRLGLFNDGDEVFRYLKLNNTSHAQDRIRFGLISQGAAHETSKYIKGWTWMCNRTEYSRPVWLWYNAYIMHKEGSAVTSIINNS